MHPLRAFTVKIGIGNRLVRRSEKNAHIIFMEGVMTPELDADLSKGFVGDADLRAGIGAEHFSGGFIVRHKPCFAVRNAPIRIFKDIIWRHKKLVGINQAAASDTAPMQNEDML